MDDTNDVDAQSSWLWDHIGRISGMVLGLIAFGFVAFLAIIGYRPALFFLMLILAFVALVAVGGRMRGGR